MKSANSISAEILTDTDQSGVLISDTERRALIPSTFHKLRQYGYIAWVPATLSLEKIRGSASFIQTRQVFQLPPPGFGVINSNIGEIWLSHSHFFISGRMFEKFVLYVATWEGMGVFPFFFFESFIHRVIVWKKSIEEYFALILP